MSERVVCTVVTKNYLAYARTLAETLKKHHPQIELYVLLADRIDDYFQPEAESFKVIQLEELPDQQAIEQMSFYYTPLEFCCALRGLLHEYILEHTTAESWLFLDCDIFVYDSLDSIFQILAETSLLLSPHCTKPVPLEDAEHEIKFLVHGINNGGFLGLRRTEQTRQFIAWWKGRLLHYCFLDCAIGDPRGLAADQLWLNLAIVYFPDFKFLLHPGTNIGHWNFYEKTFGRDAEGKVTVNQEPLLFLHFSGWDINKPRFVSSNTELYQEADQSPWAELAELYREKLLKNGYEETRRFPYTFATFSDRTLITQAMRRGYYDELKQGTAIADSPFDNPEYFRSKRYSLNSTHFLQEEVRIAYEQVIQLQQEKHQVYLTLEQTQTALHQQQVTLEHKDATLQQLEATFQQLEAKLAQTQTELVEVQQNAEMERIRSRQTIEAMENSIFWKMRNTWWQIKQKLGHAEVKLLEKE